jgi:hypothetical protein
MGDSDDHAYGARGIFAFTIELGTEFIPSAEEIDQIASDNIEAAMMLLERVNTSTLTGHVTDATTGEPVVAEIFVEGIDDTGAFRYPYLSDAAFGRYYRLLPNGTYNVTFSAEGYESTTLTNININVDGPSIEDVALTKAVTPVSLDVKANASDRPVLIRSGNNLSVTVTLDLLSHTGLQTNWWVLADTPMGWYYYDLQTKKWAVGQSFASPAIPTYLPPLEVLNISDLQTGTYTFYCGVDGQFDGESGRGSLYFDSVVVHVMP